MVSTFLVATIRRHAKLLRRSHIGSKHVPPMKCIHYDTVRRLQLSGISSCDRVRVVRDVKEW